MRRSVPLFAAALALSISACATQSVSYSEVAPGTQPVFAESSHFNFLGLTPTSLERLTELRDALRTQCGGGSVTGVVTKTSTVYAIVGVVEKTSVMGYCAED